MKLVKDIFYFLLSVLVLILDDLTNL